MTFRIYRMIRAGYLEPIEGESADAIGERILEALGRPAALDGTTLIVGSGPSRIAFRVRAGKSGRLEAERVPVGVERRKGRQS